MDSNLYSWERTHPDCVASVNRVGDCSEAGQADGFTATGSLKNSLDCCRVLAHDTALKTNECTPLDPCAYHAAQTRNIWAIQERMSLKIDGTECGWLCDHRRRCVI